jgi:hypothetical protein
MGAHQSNIESCRGGDREEVIHLHRRRDYFKTAPSLESSTQEFANHCVCVSDQKANRGLDLLGGHGKLAVMIDAKTLFRCSTLEARQAAA